MDMVGRVSLARLWSAVGLRQVAWDLDPAVQPLLGGEGLDLPRLRSALGKHARHALCPETLWQAPCESCGHFASCAWPRLFPGSALGRGDGFLSSWVLAQRGTGLLTVHADGAKGRFWAFAGALDDALAQLANLDRRRSGAPPRWISAALLVGDGTEPLLPLPWGATFPMAGPPTPLVPGSRLRFALPLQLKASAGGTAPAMADWLRLGRNRLARFAAQQGHPLWPPRDRNWRTLTDAAQDARWRWEEPRDRAPWAPIRKHGIQLHGWTGTAVVEALPDAWVPWATLIPWVGAGSHITYGCGLAEVLPPAPPARPRGPRLVWRPGLDLEG